MSVMVPTMIAKMLAHPQLGPGVSRELLVWAPPGPILLDDLTQDHSYRNS